MGKLSNNVKRGVRLFLIILIITITLLLVFTVSRQTWGAIKKMSFVYLIIALVLWFLYVLFDGIRLQIIIHGITGRWINLVTSLEVILTGSFMAAVTPFQTGGLPVQLYILYKNKISLGKGTLALFLRGIFYALFIITLIPFLIPLYRSQVEQGSMKLLPTYSIIIYSVIIIGFFVIILKPRIIKRGLLKIFYRRKKKTRVVRFIGKTFSEIEEMRKEFWRFTSKKGLHSLGAYIFTFLSSIPYYSIAPLILYGLGIKVHFFSVFFLQVFLILFTFFFPTPGGTGAVEGGFAALFATVAPRYILGVYTLIWRFFTSYITAIIGGFFTLKILKLGEIDFEREEKNK